MINKENAWDQNTELGIGPVKEVSSKKKMKLGKASGLSEVNMEMINASGKVEIDVMMKLCQRVLEGKGNARLKD